MKRRGRGLTLVELMVTLAVAIVLLAIGIPAFQGIQANNRAVTTAQGMVTALTLARTEAVGRGLPVAVCPKNATDQAGAAPSTTCGTNANWANGWIVFSDAAGTVGSRDGTDEVIRDFPTPRRPPPTITKTQGGTNLAYVRFSSQGYLSDGSSVALAEAKLQLQQADTSAGQTRCITISPLGQPRTERNTCP